MLTWLVFQLLHICMEGWGNWRWAEPFSVDDVGTLLRTIQHKGQTASLIIRVKQLTGVQKQVHKDTHTQRHSHLAVIINVI